MLLLSGFLECCNYSYLPSIPAIWSSSIGSSAVSQVDCKKLVDCFLYTSSDTFSTYCRHHHAGYSSCISADDQNPPYLFLLLDQAPSFIHALLSELGTEYTAADYTLSQIFIDRSLLPLPYP
jgi:hypothetical protein